MKMSKAIQLLNVREEQQVEQMCEQMGYGRVMQLTEQLWRRRAIGLNIPGSEHTVGPCAAFMVKCPHPVKDDNGHCEICCGAGRITKGVHALLRAKGVL